MYIIDMQKTTHNKTDGKGKTSKVKHDIILVKLGGSVITEKEGYKRADNASIGYLARELSKVRNKKIILVHGAGSFGHAPVVKYKINNGVYTDKQKLGFADTHLSVAQLSSLLVESLVSKDVLAVSIPPMVLFKQNKKRVASVIIQPILDFLNTGYMPVLYGDMALDATLGGSVLSGDQIMSVLAKELGAKQMIFVSDVEGVMINGRVVPTITKKNLKDVREHITGSRKTDVTGGMYGKIMEIMNGNVPTIITNPQNLQAAILGKKVGTLIIP